MQHRWAAAVPRQRDVRLGVVRRVLCRAWEALGGFKPTDLCPQAAGFFLPGQDSADAGQVEPVAAEGAHLEQPADVVLAVAARAAGAAGGFDQALALVDAQGLRVQAASSAATEMLYAPEPGRPRHGSGVAGACRRPVWRC
jgi:hypothetical protein